MREVWFSLATRQPFAAECPSGSTVHDWRITSECGTNRNAARHHQQHATRTLRACAREDHTAARGMTHDTWAMTSSEFAESAHVHGELTLCQWQRGHGLQHSTTGCNRAAGCDIVGGVCQLAGVAMARRRAARHRAGFTSLRCFCRRQCTHGPLPPPQPPPSLFPPSLRHKYAHTQTHTQTHHRLDRMVGSARLGSARLGCVEEPQLFGVDASRRSLSFSFSRFFRAPQQGSAGAADYTNGRIRSHAADALSLGMRRCCRARSLLATMFG
jgi:hypothetical protein